MKSLPRMLAALWILLQGVAPMGLAQQMPGGPGLLPVPGGPSLPVPDASIPESGRQPPQPPSVDGGAPVADGEEKTLRLHRDPFWPVGYVPPKPEKPVEAGTAGPEAGRLPPPVPVPLPPAEWDQARAQLDLRGVSSIGRDRITGKTRFVAVMAGKLVEEGSIVSIIYDGQVYRWRVVAVNAAGVQLVKMDVRAE